MKLTIRRIGVPNHVRQGRSQERLRGVLSDALDAFEHRIPNPSRKFDGIGAFVQPSQLQLHMQIAYDITPRVSLVANLANILSECFGGSKTGCTVAGACSYNILASGATGDVGNLYNPGSPTQPYVSAPYVPAYGITPYSKHHLVSLSARELSCNRFP